MNTPSYEVFEGSSEGAEYARIIETYPRLIEVPESAVVTLIDPSKDPHRLRGGYNENLISNDDDDESDVTLTPPAIAPPNAAPIAIPVKPQDEPQEIARSKRKEIQKSLKGGLHRPRR